MQMSADYLRALAARDMTAAKAQLPRLVSAIYRHERDEHRPR